MSASETTKSNSQLCVLLEHNEAFSGNHLHIRSLLMSQLHLLTLESLNFCVQASRVEHSNENHSSQSSLPETKGQCNLGKLLKLQSNLL